ncbi:MAG TPA: hypothetical protein VD862_01340 [Candidatus Paceibacterota bacterium]|nr:hypothetical protein [Candidatus Paceibacterota bacterium]
MKRTAIFILCAAGIAALPAWFWYSFLRDIPVGNGGTATFAGRFATPDPEAPETPEIPRPRLRELLSYPVVALSADRNRRDVRMYEEGTGRAFAVNTLTLKVTTLSDERLERFITTVWSPNGTEVISAFAESGGTQFRYFDYRTGRVAPLPASVRLFAFSPDGGRIATVRTTDGGVRLWISSPDGTGEFAILATRLNITALSWPAADELAVVTRHPSGAESVVMVSMEGKLRPLRDGIRGAELNWSPNGTRALVSHVTDDARVLELMDAATGDTAVLGIHARAGTCAWHTDQAWVTCGLPAQPNTTAEHAVIGSVVSTSLTDGTSVVRYRPGAGETFGMRSPFMVSGDTGIAFLDPFSGLPYLLSW